MFIIVFVVDCPLCVIGLSSRTSSWCLMETVGGFFDQLANVTGILQLNKYIFFASDRLIYVYNSKRKNYCKLLIAYLCFVA